MDRLKFQPIHELILWASVIFVIIHPVFVRPDSSVGRAVD